MARPERLELQTNWFKVYQPKHNNSRILGKNNVNFYAMLFINLA